MTPDGFGRRSPGLQGGLFLTLLNQASDVLQWSWTWLLAVVIHSVMKQQIIRDSPAQLHAVLAAWDWMLNVDCCF